MFFNDVGHLQAIAYQFLVEADRPLPTHCIARQLFGPGRHELPETQVVVRALLANDSRFLETHDRRWSAREAKHVCVPLNEANFVVVDLETTGSLIGVDEIIEIGLVVCREGKITRNFSSLVCTERKIPVWVESLTGIRREDLGSAPSFSDLVVTLNPFFTNAVFVAHDILFDLPFLRWEYANRDMRMPGVTGLCTLRLSRQFWPQLPSRSLPDLARHFGINHSQPHRAGQDATATAEILCLALEKAQEAGLSVIGDLFPPKREWYSADAPMKSRAEAAE
jgi:DNA polymerase III epsilon subunit family exonuclease